MEKKARASRDTWHISDAELRKPPQAAPAPVMLIPLMTWAEQNNVNPATARKYAQLERIIGATKRGKIWHVPINAKVPEPGQVGNPNFKRIQPAQEEVSQ